MTKTDLLDLNILINAQIVSFNRKGNDLYIYIVGDCEEDETLDHHDDEHGDSCCDGLNGHLFLLHFKDVKNFIFKGEECDNYKTKNVNFNNSHLGLILDGINFIEDNSNVEIDFDFSSYSVIDKWVIEGPDA